MGKRRDRRQQQQASGRRVKLDLSMDDDVLPPSETPGSLEVLDSALGEEVKAGAMNQEAANDNPLSLLGQYSDDEADDDGDFGASSLQDIEDEARKDSLKNQDEQLVVQKDMAHSQTSVEISLEEKWTTGTQGISSDEQKPKDDPISDIRVQDAASEDVWQPVLDEDSGEYYYWNVQTGETTWMKPIEGGSADKVGSSTIQATDLDPLSGINLEYHRDETWIENDHLGSSAEHKSPARESCSVQYRENAIMHLESAQNMLDNSNAGLVSGSNDLAGDSSTAEKVEDVEDLEKMAIHHVGPEFKKEEDKKKEEESPPSIKNDEKDSNFEVTYNIQGASEKDAQQIETQITSISETCAEKTCTVHVIPGDLHDVSGENPMLTKEAQRTIEEKMASLVETGESLHRRLNVLARESCGGVSRHSLMASQTEARLSDWKAFCALGFVPDACLSFIKEELARLELILATEEASESERKKLVNAASTLLASHEIRSEFKNSDWSLNWAYYQQDNVAVSEPCKEGQSIKVSGNNDDVEEGEIQTYPTTCISESTATINAPAVSTDTAAEDVDMDVDMEVDVEVEAEPAVPGMSSGVSASDIPVPYSYYPLPGSNNMSTLGHFDSACVGEPMPYYHMGASRDSWAPPLPPDDEWAPPPPGESEPAPPPPPDEPPPLPPQSPGVDALNTPSMPPVVQIQYFVPEYAIENNPLPHCSSATDYQSIIDSSVYGTLVEGVIYSNCTQPAETLEVEQPYGVVSSSTPAFNGWTAPVLAPTPSLKVKGPPDSSLVNPMFSEAPMKSSSYAPPVSSVISKAADSAMVGASLETKKLAKGKMKKRTHAIAAAPMLNKKVSSLVSKWKQAKEELHGDEDEDEDKALYDVEVLEKKRQKEIEEWRRQQIASGEALDNANFQPLGTLDWRERVKRARKAESKAGEEWIGGSLANSSTAEGQTVEALKSQKPNLTDLSKGLPPGWQAYWDEASGEVYYGNLITQETTWDRPVT